MPRLEVNYTEYPDHLALRLNLTDQFSDAAQKAAALASATNKPVHFTFNDIAISVEPGQKPADIDASYKTAFLARRAETAQSPTGRRVRRQQSLEQNRS